MKHAHTRDMCAIIVRTYFPVAHLTSRKQGHLYPEALPELEKVNKVCCGISSSGQAMVQTLGKLGWVDRCLSKKEAYADREKELGR